MIAESSEKSQELQKNQAITKKRAAKRIGKIITSFTHKGPNGDHLCIVPELLGPSLDTVVASYGTLGDRLEPEVILKITRQLLQALSALQKVGYAHGGTFTYML